MNHFRLFLAVSLLCVALPVHAAVVPLVFPVEGGGRFIDDFNDGSGSGRLHHGIDIHAPQMTHVLAPVDGRIRWLNDTEPSYGWMLKLDGDDGNQYHFIHLNNDTPGTDDGRGGRQNAYAPGIESGVRVSKGQHIAYVGDSGNAESIGPHLHFEIRLSNGAAINPFESLIAALGGTAYSRTEESAGSADINTDRGISLAAAGERNCDSGTLIRSHASSAVYYCGADGRRYVFPNEKTYFTWYADFSGVKQITDAEMASIMIGGNVTYRPGVRLVKIQSDPKVYAVSKGGVLRPIPSASVASAHFGASWAKQIDDIPEAFFVNYTVGDPVSAVN